MNYYLAISFILAALLKRVISSGRATLYYYNRNTYKVEYICDVENDVVDVDIQPLYIKRYFVVIILSNCTETLERRIWLLLHSQQLGLTTARSISVRHWTVMCIFPENMENKAIYRIVLLYFTIILLMLIISRFKGATSLDCQGSSCWYPWKLNSFTV